MLAYANGLRATCYDLQGVFDQRQLEVFDCIPVKARGAMVR